MTTLTTDHDLWTKAQSLSTAEISDALDALGLPGSVIGIQRMAGPAKIFGKAFTVRFTPVDTSQPGTVGEFLDEVPGNSVIVLDNAGRRDCTVWGGIMSTIAMHRGIAGTVVNGVCRDTVEADAVGYPLYAAGHFMRTGKDRVQAETVGGVVMLGDVRVAPGDLIVGDQDGLLVVPADKTQHVLERAVAIQETEKQILTAGLAGMPLVEARKRFGYHALQRTALRNNQARHTDNRAC